MFNIAVALSGFLGGWWVKTIWESLKDLQKEDQKLSDKVAHIEVLVAGQYVRKSDFDRTADALFIKLDKIYEKLDTKVDK